MRAAGEASPGGDLDISTCRDAFEYALALLSCKQSKAEDQLVTHQQLRSESRVSLFSASGDGSEGILVATEDSYGSFQVRQATSKSHAEPCSIVCCSCRHGITALCHALA